MHTGGCRALQCATSTLRATRAARPAYSYTPQRHRSTEVQIADLNPRWLGDVKRRIGHCMTWGLKPDQTLEAGEILQEIARDWRELLAGSDGFLTSKERRSTFRQQVVWGEQDAMGHVNNVVYNRYAETGRVDWFHKIASLDTQHSKEWKEILTPKGDGLILRKITTEFKFPMRYPDHVSIYHKLSKKPVEGTDTFDMDVLILSELHQRPAAKCVEDCVLYDYRVAKRTPLRPFMLEVMRETWRLQEEAKRYNGQRVRRILDRVRTLEAESWDREGAVEDLGSASSKPLPAALLYAMLDMIPDREEAVQPIE